MANMKDTHRMRIYPPTPEHVAITKSVQEVEDMFTQDIRETLYADDGIVSVVEKLNERTVINNDVMVHPTQAYLEVQKEGNGIRLDAVAYGSQGNDIMFSCKNSDELVVGISGLLIAVVAPLATTSITDVVTAINTNEDANKLVTASVIGNGATTIDETVPQTPLAGGVDVTHGEDGEAFFDGVNIYVSDGESKEDVDNWISAPLLPTLPTVIDLKDASKDYVIEDGKNSIVVLTDNNAVNANRIVLPAAIVGLRVTIINQDNASVDISPASGEYINGSDSSTPVTTLTSATFYCYADGYWATI